MLSFSKPLYAMKSGPCSVPLVGLPIHLNWSTPFSFANNAPSSADFITSVVRFSVVVVVDGIGDGVDDLELLIASSELLRLLLGGRSGDGFSSFDAVLIRFLLVGVPFGSSFSSCSSLSSSLDLDLAFA